MCRVINIQSEKKHKHYFFTKKMCKEEKKVKNILQKK